MRYVTAFLLATVLAGVQASAQTILGRHPADTLVPQLFQQNSNVQTVLAAINSAATPVTNINLSAANGAGTATNLTGAATNQVAALAQAVVAAATNGLAAGAYSTPGTVAGLSSNAVIGLAGAAVGGSNYVTRVDSHSITNTATIYSGIAGAEPGAILIADSISATWDSIYGGSNGLAIGGNLELSGGAFYGDGRGLTNLTPASVTNAPGFWAVGWAVTNGYPWGGLYDSAGAAAASLAVASNSFTPISAGITNHQSNVSLTNVTLGYSYASWTYQNGVGLVVTNSTPPIVQGSVLIGAGSVNASRGFVGDGSSLVNSNGPLSYLTAASLVSSNQAALIAVGAASAATNNLASGAFTAVGTAATLSSNTIVGMATNGLGTAAFTAASAYDAAGVAATAALNATNNFRNGALLTNLAVANMAGTGTNGGGTNLGVMPPFEVNPYQFGGSPSLTDNSAAFQAMFNFANAGLHGKGSAVYIPQGVWHFTNTVWLTNVYSMYIYGAGKNGTILSEDFPIILLKTWGFQYSTVKNISFQQGAGPNVSAIVSLDGGGSYIGVQANTFENCFFAAGLNAAKCLNMVPSNLGNCMGSENTFINCHFSGATVYAYAQYCFNALDNNFVGGDCQICTNDGLYAQAGTFNVRGMSFENGGATQNGYDIHMVNSAYEASSIIGCRSESLHFLDSDTATTLVQACRTMPNYPTWASNTVYTAGTLVTENPDIGILWRCLTGGTSSNTQPVWVWSQYPSSAVTMTEGTGVQWQQVNDAIVNGPHLMLQDCTFLYGLATASVYCGQNCFTRPDFVGPGGGNIGSVKLLGGNRVCATPYLGPTNQNYQIGYGNLGGDLLSAPDIVNFGADASLEFSWPYASDVGQPSMMNVGIARRNDGVQSGDTYTNRITHNVIPFVGTIGRPMQTNLVGLDLDMSSGLGTNTLGGGAINWWTQPPGYTTGLKQMTLTTNGTLVVSNNLIVAGTITGNAASLTNNTPLASLGPYSVMGSNAVAALIAATPASVTNAVVLTNGTATGLALLPVGASAGMVWTETNATTGQGCWSNAVAGSAPNGATTNNAQAQLWSGTNIFMSQTLASNGLSVIGLQTNTGSLTISGNFTNYGNYITMNGQGTQPDTIVANNSSLAFYENGTEAMFMNLNGGNYVSLIRPMWLGWDTKDAGASSAPDTYFTTNGIGGILAHTNLYAIGTVNAINGLNLSGGTNWLTFASTASSNAPAAAANTAYIFSQTNAAGAAHVYAMGSDGQINQLSGTRVGNGGGLTNLNGLKIVGGLRLPLSVVSTNYTLATTDYTIVCPSNSVAWTLPTATGAAGQIYNLKNVGTGTVTINTTSGQTIDGNASGVLILKQYDSLTVQTDGVNWYIL